MKKISILFTLIFAFLVFAGNANAQCSVTLSTYEINLSPYVSHTPPPPIEITAPAGCAWRAVSNAGWINFYMSTTSPAATVSGTGSATITPYITGNDGDPRTATIVINDKTIVVKQSSSCSYYFRNEQYFNAEGGTRDYALHNNRASGNCSFTYSTDTPWITLSSTTYTVARSDGATRQGRIAYHYGNNQTMYLIINQQAGCFYSISQSETSVSSGGGSGSLDLLTGSVCQWRAEANQEWITVTSGSGTGGAPVNYSVTPNTGTARTGIINIGGQIFTINQSAGKTRKRVRMFEFLF